MSIRKVKVNSSDGYNSEFGIRPGNSATGVAENVPDSKSFYSATDVAVIKNTE